MSYSDGIIATKIPAVLRIDNSSQKAIYEVKISQAQKIKDTMNPDENELYQHLQTKESSFSVYDKNARTSLFFGFLGKEEVYIVDTIPVIKWEILNETKNIMDIKCHKALTTFRGRNWIAWVALDFPISYGPSNFQDLPGAILEINDDANKFKIVATKITKTSDNFKSYFDQFTKKKADASAEMTLKEFKEKEKEGFESFISEMQARGSKTPTYSEQRHGYEILYEWE
ncbi:hypothetical protein EB1_25160 [Empedobacter brevis NBRC 14943 = ATCC 43319]|uniref:GLPGLI family protein n=2 Tax=Empedobacter brevis TaxID=247 RepID=A0A511NJ11_9FLAO|nr:hypothetical protein EB1_25160 [Empedobacter brevis NBRC 14943 = ATCC 43319]